MDDGSTPDILGENLVQMSGMNTCGLDPTPDELRTPARRGFGSWPGVGWGSSGSICKRC